MFKKRLLLALAAAALSFGNTAMAGTTPSVFSSFDCTGGGNETFSNIGAASSAYATRTWTGNNSVAWSATDARTDQDLTGDAIALRTSTLKNTSVVAGGVGTLTFNYKRVFTGNSTLKVFVNGVQYGGDVTVSSETTAVFSQLINVTGNVTIEIRNSGNRVIVDDIVWTCYATPAGPEIQLANASGVNQDCGALNINYGAQLVGVYADAVFTVKNSGSSNLVVSSLVLSNTADFSIISPSVPFTVAPSSSSIVLVRFNSATSGSKTSTLTINSNDTDEAACVVNLEGLAQEPCVAPGEQDPTINIADITYSSADMTVEDILADGYIAILSTSSTLSNVPQDGVNYTIGNTIGGGTVVYTGSLANFDATGLTGSTEYYLFIFAYNANCGGGPLYNTETEISRTFTTLEAPCIGGSESFSNIGTASSAYATRTWTGDNGVAWSATDARTDQSLTGNAIAMRTGILTNTTAVSGGVGTLSFNYKRVFTGNSTLKVFVNNVQYGGDITVSSDSTAVYSQLIDVTGSVTIRIENSGNRVIIDDLLWSCYETPDRPEILLLDSNLSPKACGNFTIDLGAVEANTLQESTFTIKNSGLQNLVISSISIDDTTNYTIVAPTTIPATIAPLATLDVTVHFNSATIGSKPAVLTIASNDADEASCVVNFAASVQDLCVAPSIATGDVTVSNETSSSADITVTGVTAGGYIALVSTDITITTAPTNGTAYTVGTVIGNAVVGYVGTNAAFTIENLDPATSYTVNVYAFNNTGCISGPIYAAELDTKVITTEAPCTGNTETFANIGANSSAYAVRNWTGDNGVTWTATDARTDQTLNGKAIAFRTGSVTNTVPVSGGMGTLTFNYMRVFTGNSTLKVFVNGVQYGGDITVSLTTPTQFSFAVNVTGDVTVELENSGNRIIVDDLAWDCYSGAQAKNLNLGLPTNKVAETTAISLYPNPNNGQFQIDLATENADVVIYNVLGKTVLNKKVSDNEVINLENAEKGIYMVVITSGSEVSTKKIIIN